MLEIRAITIREEGEEYLDDAEEWKTKEFI